VTITQGEHAGEGISSTASPPGNNSHSKILPYMNNTDLGGGDYNTTHLPAGTDPHQCAALCMQDPKCMVWVYVIRGKPAGSGDCIFKNENHECPSASPHSTKQGMCTAGRGHEPIGHRCKPVPKPGPPHPPAHKDVMPPVRILKGESLDVRGTHKNKTAVSRDLKSICVDLREDLLFLDFLSWLTDSTDCEQVRVYVDRPVVEIFINGGRAAFTHAAADFALNSTAVRVFNDGKTAVTASNVSVHGMGCGWTAMAPTHQ
jgi:hypothetical protein